MNFETIGMGVALIFPKGNPVCKHLAQEDRLKALATFPLLLPYTCTFQALILKLFLN